MRTYLAAFFMALCVAGCLTPLVRWLAYRVGATSQPGGRHINALAIPRLGGIALSIATLSPLLALFIVDSEVARIVRDLKTTAVTLVIGTSFMCLVGAWDDVRGLPALTKLLAQVVAAVFAYAWGFRIDGLLIPFLGPVSLGYLGPVVTVVWIVGITNAVNLIDGLDGLAAGVVFFAAATNLVVALVSEPKLGAVFVCLLMASLMGALLGFLFYNFNPARIFMGDSGSYFLGYTLALTSLLSPIQKASTAVSLVIPMLALGLPIFDTILSIGRRYVEKRPVFSADRGHIHHRLLDRGLTHRRTVMVLYAVTFALAALAIVTSIGRMWTGGLAVLGASAILFGLVRFLGYFQNTQQAARLSTHRYDALANRLRQVVPNLAVRLDATRDLLALRGVLESALADSGLIAVSAAVADAPLFEVTLAERSRGATDPPPHDEPFVYEGGRTRVILTLPSRAEVTPASLILLQVIADAVFAAARRARPSDEHAFASDSQSEPSAR